MILCNEFILKQQYNVLATKGNNNRINIDDKWCMAEIEITLFSKKSEDFRPIFQKEKFKEPIKFKFNGLEYSMSDYTISVNIDEQNHNISQVRIIGYMDYDKEPEFEIID